MERVPLDQDGKLYAAKVSPKELFDCMRFKDFRDYCRLQSAEKKRQEKAGYIDFGKALHQRARVNRGDE